MTIRLIALDLDGTIIGRHMHASPRVHRAIRAASDAEVTVTLASGRFFGSTLVLAQELDIRAPLICYQGALIKDAETTETLLCRGIPMNLAQAVLDHAARHRLDVAACLDDRIYVGELTSGLRFFAEYSPQREEVVSVGDLPAFLTREPLKLVFVTDEHQAPTAATALTERFGSELNVVRSFARFVEITHKAASKGQALAFLANQLGVARQETMAIGDNDNDADMVAWAGVGVAMGNATEAVKRVAVHVTGTLAEDGAATAIEHLVLGRDNG